MILFSSSKRKETNPFNTIDNYMSKLFKPWKKYLTSDKEEKTDSGTTEWNLPVLVRSKA